MYQILGTGGDLCYEMEYERQRHLVIRSRSNWLTKTENQNEVIFLQNL